MIQSLKTGLAICFVFMGGEVGGQGKTFFDKNDGSVDSAGSYYFTISRSWVISQLVPGRKRGQDTIRNMVDTVVSYFTSSHKVMERKVYWDKVQHGLFISYYENGRIREKGTYYKGAPVGYVTTGYPIGYPHKAVLYAERKDFLVFKEPTLMSYWDSLGNQLVVRYVFPINFKLAD